MAKAIVRRQPLHEQASDLLREMIVQGTLRPKQRISEKDLCDQLEISRTPLREALKLLAAEGLVTLFARRGAAVSEITNPKLEEQFEAVRMIEGFSVLRIRDNCTPKLIDELQTLHDEMAAALSKASVKRYFALSEQFHKAIVGATGNQTLIEMHAALLNHLRRARLFGLRSPIGKEFINSHARIIGALRKRDFARAQTEISLHVEAVQASVFQAIKGN